MLANRMGCQELQDTGEERYLSQRQPSLEQQAPVQNVRRTECPIQQPRGRSLSQTRNGTKIGAIHLRAGPFVGSKPVSMAT